ncbi:hypothetical protein ASD15_09420 [Massilia sp. Root351]|uniref:T6SS effector BTH_I2691 family protein n=1 Tax=Massilia sp. Root351 TaxID=1736522 RepID=UPI0007096FA5|nr:T6SS effector BTH_I2691 family protein [Massilia sp. Root351]KQV82263.1 hypothetical protein ASD15_09420 [Massilia sp. Root351]
MVTNTGCDVCRKSSLSLLFLRPSPIAKSKLIAATGADKVAADAAVTGGLLPMPLPRQSRFALRLLRAGYVHIYVESPPAGVPNWLVYRVTEHADLVPESHELFSQPDAPVPCKRPEHIATGMKVAGIPQAHKIKELWVAYSVALWSDKLRDKNKADPLVMQKISLQSCGPNSFVPTADRLKEQVLECALGTLKIDGATDHDFPFNSIAGKVDELAANLTLAAAKHPKTAGKEMAIVLRDPVGIATELNALRIRRNSFVKREIEKPENLHPLNSSHTVLGLKQSLVDEADLTSYDDVSPLRTKKSFDAQRHLWPKDAYARPLTEEERQTLIRSTQCRGALGNFLLSGYQSAFEKEELVRVVFADHDARAAAWTEKKAKKNWAKFTSYYDEEERAAWVKQFEAKMKADHYDPIELLEQDWFAATRDAQTLTYFARHFDSNVCSLPYSSENSRINEPGPFIVGPVMKRYAALLDLPITAEDSVALRAMVGNMDRMIKQVHVQLTGDPGAEGMRDKTYDLVKGFSELQKAKNVMGSHGWLGHSLALFSVGQLSALSGAALALASHAGNKTGATASMLGKLQSLSLVQSALEIAVEGALKGNAPKLPVLVTMKVNADDALAIFAARSGQPLGISKTRIKKARANHTKIQLTLLTDTDAIKAANGKVADVANNPAAGTVKMGSAATTAAVAKAGSSVFTMSEETFLQLYQGQASTAAKSANLMRSALPNMAQSATGSHMVAVAKTLDARLALASMVIQTIGVMNGLAAVSNAKDESAAIDANYGMMDSVFGFTGGALALWTVAAEIDISKRLGPAAANLSVKLALLRIAGNLTGVAGGAINAIASRKKSKDQAELGNTLVADLYTISAYAFAGTGVTSGALTIGAVAGALETRAIGGAVVRTVATRLAANAVLGTVAGVGLTVSGVGLLLLGAGVAIQVAAIVLTPNELQRWLGRSYFGRDGGFIVQGKRDDMFAKGDWRAERAALDEVMKNTAEEQKAAIAQANSGCST